MNLVIRAHNRHMRDDFDGFHFDEFQALEVLSEQPDEWIRRECYQAVYDGRLFGDNGKPERIMSHL